MNEILKHPDLADAVFGMLVAIGLNHDSPHIAEAVRTFTEVVDEELEYHADLPLWSSGQGSSRVDHSGEGQP